MEYKKSYSSKKKDSRKYESKDLRKDGDSETRKFEGEMKPLMTEEDASRDQWNQGSTEQRTRPAWNNGKKESQNYGKDSVDPEIRKFDNPLKPLMSEDEKSKAQILDLSYDFSCRIIRLYKYLNEGKLGKADRDIIDALGRQLVRSATSINANMNEAQHPQSDADFLSKASIALKEARESENWLRLLSDNGYLEPRAAESLLLDCARINKILITITSKVKKRINGSKD